MKVRTRFAILGVVLALGIVVFARVDLSATQAGTAQTLLPRTQIGFSARLSEAEIRTVLERHRVTPVAAFIWTSGLTTTHRTSRQVATGEFLQQARAQAIVAWEKGLNGNMVRLKKFTEKYSEDEVASSTALTTEAKSLFNTRSAFAHALGDARSGSPLIFGVEVIGSEADLTSLRADPIVMASIDSARTINSAGRKGLKPDEYNQAWIDPLVQVMDTPELYRAIQELASSRD